MLHLPSLMLAYHFGPATLLFSAAEGCLRHPPPRIPHSYVALLPLTIPTPFPQKVLWVHETCVVQSKYFVLLPHPSSNQPGFCDEKDLSLLHKNFPSLASKPAPKLNQSSPKIRILFLYFQNDCGFRTSSATTHRCRAPFLEEGTVSLALSRCRMWLRATGITSQANEKRKHRYV